MKFVLWCVLIFIVCCLPTDIVAAQGPAPDNHTKTLVAFFTEEAIRIDGKLDETAWKQPANREFVQSEPTDGAAPSEITEVWVAYNRRSLYVAARMHDADPAGIVRRLGRRDTELESDWFEVALDPTCDRQNGYLFAVNPAGSLRDYVLYNDVFRNPDWDGIWNAAAAVDGQGWVVEMEIPFDQLRFRNGHNGMWGVNFLRLIKRKNESQVFARVPKGDSGYVSRFATLTGLGNIQAGRLLEVIPYTVGKAAFTPAETGNPFADGTDWSTVLGLDARIGLNSNLTLNLTVNPDFGQVEVDPAQINLSAQETYYPEKRPFFIEGSTVFDFGSGGTNTNIGANWASPDFFYSRRIGRAPQGEVDADGYVRYPEQTTILGAAKVTGKVFGGWNLGFLSALTAREYAEIDRLGQRGKAEVEPFSHYGVWRMQRSFRDGRHALGFLATSVVRDLRAEPLAAVLRDNAFAAAMDGWVTFDKKQMWVLSGWFGATRVAGSSQAIWNLQNSFPHYYQRPDADYLHPNRRATSLSGFAGRLTFNKQKGRLRFNVAMGAVSPGFDSSDLGFLWDADVINAHVMLGYRSYTPDKVFRNWQVSLITQRNYDFGGNKIGEQRLIVLADAQFLNYWQVNGQISVNPWRYSHSLTRGGPLMKVPPRTWGNVGITSDDRRPIILDWTGYHSRSQADEVTWDNSVGITWKPRSNFDIRINPGYCYERIATQWVKNVDDAEMTATFGRRHVFGRLGQKTAYCDLRLNWIFSPRLSLQAYIQPYISVGSYSEFKELARPSSYDFHVFGANGSTKTLADGVYIVDPDGAGPAPAFRFSNPDFNYKSLRGTVVLRWEYRPGSVIYAVWTQRRSDFQDPGDFSLGRDLGHMFSARGENIFMVKFTYRFKM